MMTNISQQQQQPSRKQRRCWSLELHGCFFKALQQLGGSQAATLKQIRELMKVDGLTNDGVESHLQKYRLHSRRAPATATPASPSGGCIRTMDDPRSVWCQLKGQHALVWVSKGPLSVGRYHWRYLHHRW